MAVDPEQIEQITRSTVQLYRHAEQALLQLITRRLAQGLDTPAWARERLAALGALRTAAQDILGQLAADAGDEIATAVAEAYRQGDTSALTDLPKDAATALAAQEATAVVTRSAAMESLAAALHADVGVRHANVLRDVLDAYRTVVAQATSASIGGGLTRRQAAQLAYQRFVDRGLTSFTDRRGRRWRLSSYVEMALRTVTQRAAIQGQTDRQQRLGLNLVMVSNEAQECKLCRPYEGRVLRIDAGPTGQIRATNPLGGTETVDVKATLDEARARGFQHPSCRHSVRAYLPGVTQLPPQPTADPKGDAARQRQRAIERAIRRWKEREHAALTPEAKAQARARVRLWQANLRGHLAANPSLKRLPYREAIGAGNAPKQAAKVAQPRPPAQGPKPAAAAKPAPAKPKPVPPPAPKPRSFDDRLAQAATGDAALRAVPAGLGRTTFTSVQEEALRDYESAFFTAINGQLRRRDVSDSMRQTVAAIDSTMQPLTADVQVWRGVAGAERIFGDRMAGNLTGAEWVDDAYTSTSASTKVAKDFLEQAAIDGTSVQMRILAPAGTKAVQISGSGRWEQAEILLARSSRLRVVADRGIVDGVRRIDVEVLGD